MCNLYAVRKSVDVIAAHFAADIPKPIDGAEDIAKGGTGLVIRAQNGRRLLQQVKWGFPRLTREMRERGVPPEPVNLVANLTSPMWEKTVVDPRYRCLIPVEQFAEPDGLPGKKTRTWFSVKGEPIFAWAGFCRNTEAWGPCYAGMTTDSNEAVKLFNPRMPVLLRPEDWDRWLSGSIEDVIEFQFRQYPADQLTINPTDEPWIPRRVSSPPSPQAAFL